MTRAQTPADPMPATPFRDRAAWHAALTVASLPPVIVPPPRRSSAWRIGVRLAAVGVLAWWAMRPAASPVPAGPPPTWHVQLATGGVGAPWALVYGRHVGFHLMRLPERSAATELPMQLADREVKMISLGWAPLAVHGDAGGAGGLRAFSATGHVVTVYQNGRGTGVRTGF